MAGTLRCPEVTCWGFLEAGKTDPSSGDPKIIIFCDLHPKDHRWDCYGYATDNKNEIFWQN